MTGRVSIAVLVLCSGLPGLALAQAPPGPEEIDGRKIETAYTGQINGNVSRVSMTNGMSQTVRISGGRSLITSLSIGQTKYRLQDKRDDARNLSSNLVWPIRKNLTINGILADRRFFNRVITFNGELQDFINNSQVAEARVNYTQTLSRGLRLLATSTLAISKGEETFLESQNRDAMVNGGLNYVYKNVQVTGRGFIRRGAQDAETSVASVKGLGINEDSLSTRVNLKISDHSNISAGYAKFTREGESMDLPRGVFQEQQLDQELVREVEIRNVEVININAQTRPFSKLRMRLSTEHNDNFADYKINQKRFSHVVSDYILGDITYSPGPKTTISVNLDNREAFHELLSVGSYTDRKRSLRFNLNQSFTPTFITSVQGGVTLSQNFYLDFDLNPRDRDQVDQFINVRMNSQPFHKTSANAYLAVSQRQIVNIHTSLSQSNRTETTYDFRPGFSYRINERVEFVQAYGLNIGFTEFAFQEDDNILDRNITFTNTIKADMTQRLYVELYYSLLLHDRGSYLRPSPTEERLLDIIQEDRRDQMTVSFRYAVTPQLALVGRNDYSQRRDTRVGSGQTSVFTDGGVDIGVEGSYKLGEGRDIRFKLRKVNRFGRFNTKAQEDFWVMDSSIRYAF